ncbi:MAG: ferritin family protein [Bacteroidales bacterium]|nr:ferritin family protein [Bacteroidales bacterium]
MYYSGKEIIEIAVRIEENGNEFYTAAAEAIKGDNDIKGLLLDLAEKELLHIAVFQKLEEQFEAETFEFNADEASDYISNLADQHVFGKAGAGAELAKTVHTPQEALAIAFKFENDSVEFYTEMEKRTGTNAKQLIRQIIEEEKEHAAEIQTFM